METIIGDYIWTTIAIHSPIPYQAPDRRRRSQSVSELSAVPGQQMEDRPVNGIKGLYKGRNAR